MVAGVKSGLLALRNALPFPVFLTRSRTWREILDGARENYGLWPVIADEITEGLSEDDTELLHRRFRHESVRATAVLHRTFRMVFNASLTVAACFPAASIALGAIALWTSRGRPLLLLVSIAAFALAAAPAYAVLRVINRPSAGVAVAALVTGAGVLVVANGVAGWPVDLGLGLMWSAPAGVLDAVAKGFAYAGWSCVLLGAMIPLAFGPTWFVYETVLIRRAAFESALMAGMNLGLIITGDRYGLRDLWARRWGVRELERLARCLERGFLRQVPVSQSRERAEVQARLAASAAGARSWQITMALPQPEAVGKLRADALLLIKALLLLDYRLLPGYDHEVSVRPQRVREALRVTRDVVVAFVPAGVLLAADRMGAPLEGALATGFWTFAVAWLVVGLIRVINPLSLSQMGTVKDLFSMFRSPEA